MILDQLFEGNQHENGHAVVKQLMSALKDKTATIDLMVGNEMLPLQYWQINHLMSIFKHLVGKTPADKLLGLFGDIEWLNNKLDSAEAKAVAGSKVGSVETNREVDEGNLNELSGNLVKTAHTVAKDKLDKLHAVANPNSPKMQKLISKKTKQADRFAQKAQPAEGRYDDADDEDAQQDFYVGMYSEEGKAFVGRVTQEGGKWKEKTVKGTPPYNWGGSYMSYLTPQDVMTWIHKDYNDIDIEGPFDTEEEAIEFVEFQYGSLDEAAPGAINNSTPNATNESAKYTLPTDIESAVEYVNSGGGFIRYDDSTINWLGNGPMVQAIEAGRLKPVHWQHSPGKSGITGWATPETLVRGKTTNGHRVIPHAKNHEDHIHGQEFDRRASNKGVTEAMSEYEKDQSYGVRYKVFAGREQRLTTKEKYFKTSQAMETWLEFAPSRIDGWYEVDSFHFPNNGQDVAESNVNELWANRTDKPLSKKAEKEYLRRREEARKKKQPAPTQKKEVEEAKGKRPPLKKFIDNADGAVQCLKSMSDSSFFKELEVGSPHTKVIADGSAKGVWAIDNYKTGVRVIIYMGGYPDVFDRISDSNDFETGTIPKSFLKRERARLGLSSTLSKPNDDDEGEFFNEGYQYHPEYEDEPGENRKIWHKIVNPKNGFTLDADFSPYEEMDDEDIKNYVKMRQLAGKSLRNGIGPWDKKSLQDYHTKGVSQSKRWKDRHHPVKDITEDDTPLKDKADLMAKRKALQALLMDPRTAKDQALKIKVMQRKNALEKQAQAMGLNESRKKKK